MKWIPILKTGQRFSSNIGLNFDFTSQKIDDVIKINQGREIPVAIGQIKHNSPAWAWVFDLKRIGEILYAKTISQVVEFTKWAEKIPWNKVQITFKPDLTMLNIALMGAIPPVDVLPPEIDFSKSKTFICEFSERNLLEWNFTPQQIADKAREYQESESRAGRTISITDAVYRITRGSK